MSKKWDKAHEQLVEAARALGVRDDEITRRADGRFTFIRATSESWMGVDVSRSDTPLYIGESPVNIPWAGSSLCVAAKAAFEDGVHVRNGKGWAERLLRRGIERAMEKCR